jgi:hypothetical protein
MYLIRPPCFRSDLMGNAYWAPWWRTSILVQSPTSLPLPSMAAQNPRTTHGYILHALTMTMEMAISYLTSINIITPEYLTTTSTLLPTPDGSYIISHLCKDTSSQLTNFVISLSSHPPSTRHACYQRHSDKNQAPYPHHHCRLPPSTNRPYSTQPSQHNHTWKGICGPLPNPLTQTTNPTIPIPKVHQTKELTRRRSEKMTWVILLLQDPETVQTYEKYARESAYEADGDQPPPSNPPNRRHQNRDTPLARPKRT